MHLLSLNQQKRHLAEYQKYLPVKSRNQLVNKAWPDASFFCQTGLIAALPPINKQRNVL